MKKNQIIFAIIFLFLAAIKPVLGDQTTTTVNVVNAPPIFSASPAEQPASYGQESSQGGLIAGEILTFRAIAIDELGEEYYLAICRSNNIIPGNDAAPNCDSVEETYCISSNTSSGTTSSCNYTVQLTDSESQYTWYAFVCDKIVNGSCSPVNQGTGNSGSPFFIRDSSSSFHTPTPTSSVTPQITPTQTIIEKDESTLQVLSVQINNSNVGENITLSIKTMNWGTSPTKPSKIEIAFKTSDDTHHSYQIIDEIQNIDGFSESSQDIILPGNALELGDYEATITIYDEYNQILHSETVQFSITDKDSTKDTSVNKETNISEPQNNILFWVYLGIGAFTITIFSIFLIKFINKKKEE